MTLDQLYYFKKLAELQHFTKAATELYISQPSLSRSIHNLEEELGASLFKKKRAKCSSYKTWKRILRVCC